MNNYIKRSIEPIINKAVSQFPAVVLTGPRQSGKTTVLKKLLGENFGYISLEPPDIRESAKSDPRGFLDIYKPPVIFDEVQNVPELFPYIKESIDENRSKKGQFILTGSQNILMMSKITETLAGRTAILKLLPLTFRELSGNYLSKLPWEDGYENVDLDISSQDIWKQFIRGFYPELSAEPDRDFSLWFSSYIQTYLERDVREIKRIGDLTEFQSFLRVLAVRSGQLLNLADISRDLGISLNTAKSWLSILEATHQIIILRPYYENIGKRLVKTPKVYFTDVGLLCNLSGLKDPEHASLSPISGAIMETAVITEIYKTYFNRGIQPQIYFWRTSKGQEVDIVLENQGELIPIEVKQTATPKTTLIGGLKIFMSDYKHKTKKGWLVHLGKNTLPLSPNITAIPYTKL
ncbi:MAG: ATP-binding protein [Armatimonadota bacterium]